MNYYNEIDSFAADWIENLIKEGLIPNGIVDRRSVTEVKADDIRRFTQVHFFCGIAGWSRALRLAGWPDDRPVWTGSCPCQPFSSAGKQKGQADDRHLWPIMFRLIRECRPDTVLGEQVSSAIGHGWLDGICADLEAEDYGVGQIVLGAHCTGAPHIRQRLYWVADSDISVFQRITSAGEQSVDEQDLRTCGLEHSESNGRSEGHSDDRRSTKGDVQERSHRRSAFTGCANDGLGQSLNTGLQGHARNGGCGSEPGRLNAESIGSVAATGAWSDFYVVPCIDGKSRRIGRDVQPLAHGIPRGMGSGKPELSRLVKRARNNRVGRLKGYGNAIVPQVAAEFIKAYMELT